MARVLVGTGGGILEFGPDGRPGPGRHEGRDVTALAPEGAALWAILDGREVWRADEDAHWTHECSADSFTANCIGDTRAGVIVGTSEAHLYRMTDAGLERVEGFERVRGRDGWYTPWGGPPDSRSISEDRETVYVNVHVGGIVRTKDEGATWDPTIDIDADVHRVWAADSRVLAACARGLAVSEDRGDSWTMRTQGLHASYCRGVAVTGDTVLLSASVGPRGGRSAVYRAPAAGGAFEKCDRGLPEWFDDNIDSSCLDATPQLAAFATSDGRVFTSTDQGAAWHELASGLGPIRCLLVMP